MGLKNPTSERPSTAVRLRLSPAEPLHRLLRCILKWAGNAFAIEARLQPVSNRNLIQF